jgi:hypothetical protein
MIHVPLTVAVTVVTLAVAGAEVEAEAEVEVEAEAGVGVEAEVVGLVRGRDHPIVTIADDGVGRPSTAKRTSRTTIGVVHDLTVGVDRVLVADEEQDRHQCRIARDHPVGLTRDVVVGRAVVHDDEKVREDVQAPPGDRNWRQNQLAQQQ